MGRPKLLTSRRYCDAPMARSMGLAGKKRTNLARCRGGCKTCPACIEVDIEGKKQHVDVKRQG